MLNNVVFALIGLLLFCYVGETEMGFDASTLLSVESLKCLKEINFKLAIFRGYKYMGEIDENLCQNLKNAKKVSLRAIVYMRPCFQCGNPKEQYYLLKSYIKDCFHKSTISEIIVIDIEGKLWGSPEENKNFINELIEIQIADMSKCFIYTNKLNWENIVSNDEFASKCYLWYPKYTLLDPSFKDFIPFGGWQNPSMKQFSDNLKICNANIDVNYWEQELPRLRKYK